MNDNKEYLGDSVYVQIDEYGVVILTTENGLGPSNTIVLEYSVLKQLNEYLKRHAQETIL